MQVAKLSEESERRGGKVRKMMRSPKKTVLMNHQNEPELSCDLAIVDVAWFECEQLKSGL